MVVKLADRMGIKGVCDVWKRDIYESEWVHAAHVENIVVNLGLNLARDNVFASQSDFVGHGAVSDNTSTPASGDTSLGGNEVRKAFTDTDNSTNFESTVQYLVDATDWAAGDPGALTSVSKAGLYYQASGSNLFNAASFTAITVNTTTELQVQWKVSFNDA